MPQFKKLANVFQNHTGIILLIIFLAVFRFSLIFTGHLFWIDELHYLNTFLCLQNLSDGNWVGAIASIFNAHGRPGYILFGLIPASLQLLAGRMGILNIGNPRFFTDLFIFEKVPSFFDPAFFDPVSFFNVLITLSSTVIFYKIMTIFAKDRKAALLGTMIYGLLCNTNVYIRHILPYDLALMFFLIAFFILIRSAEQGGIEIPGAITCGICSATAFFVYPGFYMFFAIIIAGVFFYSKRRILTAFVFLVSAAVLFAAMEILSRLGNSSFFANIFRLSSTVIQGSFQQSYIFLPLYLFNVEGPIGYVLFFLFLVFLFIVVPKHKLPGKAVFWAAFLGYLYHATMGEVFHKMTFYGRLLHMYIPFIVIGAVVAVQQIKLTRWRNLAMILMLIVSLVSFGRYARGYIGLSYPLDFKYKIHTLFPRMEVLKINEIAPTPPVIYCAYPIVEVNVGQLDEVPEYFYPLKLSSEMKLVKSGLHPKNFIAYQYEGFNINDRRRLAARKYFMRIYVKDFLYDLAKERGK